VNQVSGGLSSGIRIGLVAAPALLVATLGVAALEQWAGVPNASAAYFVAVVATGVAAGTAGAVIAALGAFLLYDFLFIDPVHTLRVADPGEWLNLVLFLFVGVVVGQLGALQRARTQVAIAREREARALFRLSRALATRSSTAEAFQEIATIVRNEAGMERVWISLGAGDAGERVLADTDPGGALPALSLYTILRRTPGDQPAEWQRLHDVGRRGRAGEPGGGSIFRVRIETGDRELGSIWARRTAGGGLPDRTQTRLVGAAADQIGQALEQDELRGQAAAVEIARQGDALKSALLDSVSHDLRTPLATIRAAAGTLLDTEAKLVPGDITASAAAIDREAAYLNRLVSNVLDLSRIESGGIRAEREVLEVEDVVSRTLGRLASLSEGRPITVELRDLPPVAADPVLLEQVVGNVLENAFTHTPADTAVWVSGRVLPEVELVRVSFEDAGPGVPEAVGERLFDKFYRVPGGIATSRRGTGVGLAVARGMAEAMGGRIAARPSTLGGLAIDLDLPLAPVLADQGLG